MADRSFLDKEGTVDLTNRAYQQERKSRGYLGLPQAGHECKRHLWYMNQGRAGEPICNAITSQFEPERRCLWADFYKAKLYLFRDEPFGQWHQEV